MMYYTSQDIVDAITIMQILALFLRKRTLTHRCDSSTPKEHTKKWAVASLCVLFSKNLSQTVYLFSVLVASLQQMNRHLLRQLAHLVSLTPCVAGG